MSLVWIHIMLLKHGAERHFNLILMVIFCLIKQFELHFEIRLLPFKLNFSEINTLSKLHLLIKHMLFFFLEEHLLLCKLLVIRLDVAILAL